MLTRRDMVLTGGAAILSASCATRGAPSFGEARLLASAPVRFDYGDRLVVPVMVNEQGPFDFLLDTASSRSLIFNNLVSRLGLARRDAPPVRVLGFAGASLADLYEFNSIRFGEAAAPPAFGAPSPADWPGGARMPTGVLGLDALDGHSLRYSAELSLIEIYDRPPPIVASWPRTPLAPLALDPPVRNAPLTFRAAPTGIARFPFLFDLGASFSVLNEAAANHLRLTKGRVRTSGPSRFNDVTGVELDSYYFLTTPVFAAGFAIETMQIYVAEAPFFSEIGYRNRPFGLIGLNAMRAREFVVDFAQPALYVRR